MIRSGLASPHRTPKIAGDGAGNTKRLLLVALYKLQRLYPAAKDPTSLQNPRPEDDPAKSLAKLGLKITVKELLGNRLKYAGSLRITPVPYQVICDSLCPKQAPARMKQRFDL